MEMKFNLIEGENMESQRMCICCRQMKDKRQLLRIVKNKENLIFVDLTGKQNGRGAYICRDEECFKKLKKNKSLNKTFKCAISDEVYAKIEEAILGQK